jgi:CRP-like cAMP-binding protein
MLRLQRFCYDDIIFYKGGSQMELDYEKLAKTDLFSGIQKNDLFKMLNCLGSFQKEYKKDEIIILESDEVKSVGIILSGSVHMIKEDAEGYKTLLAAIEEGGVFGESFACGSNLYSQVSFIASCRCTVLFLPFNKIVYSCQKSCDYHHRLVENMVRLISDKNVQLMQKIEVISKKSLREKILAYLYHQAAGQKSRRFTIPLGRLELAGYLCADRSALTRELSYMKRDGLIAYDKNTFEILK